jgi:tetratricopeptide (TPR) repeat protein
LTLLAWIRFMEENSGRRWNFYALALGLFALALCSKTTACTLPAALLLILWLKGRVINRQRLVQIIPFILLGIGMGLVTIWWERYHVGTQGKLFAMGLMDRMLLANRAVWFYAAKLFWPVNLTFSYPRWIISAADPLAYVWPVATIGLGVAIYCARRFAGRSAEVAVVFYISTLCPMLGFIMLYTFFYSFVADHYQYVASIGLISLFSAGIICLAHLFKRRSPWLQMVIVAGLLLALGTMSWRQARIYRSGETLWADTLQKNPRSWMAHNNLGNLLLQKGKVDEAITHFHEALQIKPDYTEAHNNLGYALFQKGGADEAIVQYQQALQINPDYANAHNNLGLALLQQGKVEDALDQYHQALRINPDDAEAHNNLGVVLFQKGNMDDAILNYQQALQTKHDYSEAQNNLGSALLQKGKIDEAIIQYQQALQTKPDYAEANYNLGIALLQKGGADEAIAHFQNALQINPDYAKAHYSLGTTLLQKGKMAEAIFHYQQALRIKPDYAQARNNLAWVFATAPQASLRNGNQAVELAQQANQIAGAQNPTILRILAAAYAETGRFADARESAQKALDLARAAGQINLVNQINGELKLYAVGLPFHQDGN